MTNDVKIISYIKITYNLIILWSCDYNIKIITLIKKLDMIYDIDIKIGIIYIVDKKIKIIIHKFNYWEFFFHKNQIMIVLLYNTEKSANIRKI